MFIPDLPTDRRPLGFTNTERISLLEAQARLGRTMGVDRGLWLWSAGDVRWLVGHWFLFRRDLERLDLLGDELSDLARAGRPLWYRLAVGVHAVHRSLVEGAKWNMFEAPLAVRAALSACMMFAFMFALGRF